jgi:hypothetical protein
MKQYTNQDQTAKLIELGFPESETSRDYDLDIDKSLVNCAYSIGELIEFLPLELEPHPDTARRTIVGNEVLYCDEYIDWVELRFNKHKEIIDNLFDACVTLKEEGVI